MIAVLFEADALPEAQERYLQLASELNPLLSHTPGFISIYAFMLREKWLAADSSELTSVGKMHFERMGVLLNARTRRKPCCPCLDWSERRFHLGGDAGSALLTLFLQKGWITRTPGYREVNVTDSGKAAIYRLFELKVT